MGFSGRLEGIAPSDIFQMISQNRMTGTLIARCTSGTAMIVFKKGQVIEAASDEPRESLGYLLVSQGLMTEKAVQAAQERRQQTPDRSLGELLVEMGSISGQTLERVVRAQIGHIVHRLVTCEDAFLTFDRGETAVKRKLNTNEFHVPAGINAEYLIMERAQHMDEERRSGADRRRADALPASHSVPAGDEGRTDRETAGTGPAAAGPGIGAWFREKALPMAGRATGAALDLARRAMRTTGSAAVKGARSADQLIRSRALPWLRNAGEKVLAFSPDGRAFIRVGGAVVAAGALLALITTFAFEKSDSILVVTRPVANIRANPSSTSMVIDKAEKGERISQVSSVNGWYKVRTASGKSGWVWENLVEQRNSAGRAVNSIMKGLTMIITVAGAALLAAGILRKYRPSPDDAAALREP